MIKYLVLAIFIILILIVLKKLIPVVKFLVDDKVEEPFVKRNKIGSEQLPIEKQADGQNKPSTLKNTAACL
ncbi:MAG: hypothetical protein A2V66_16720 [Ignavibacteria bacterium RBG_13_36_8]|nr:MAG: hypothetical protein A2V66_16720 [Ignavibacteria bacterium RBG_13_36_8]